jgi:hypothetical protein
LLYLQQPFIECENHLRMSMVCGVRIGLNDMSVMPHGEWEGSSDHPLNH